MKQTGPGTPSSRTPRLSALAGLLYVLLARRNLPAWVYAVLAGLALIVAAVTARTIRARLA